MSLATQTVPLFPLVQKPHWRIDHKVLHIDPGGFDPSHSLKLSSTQITDPSTWCKVVGIQLSTLPYLVGERVFFHLFDLLVYRLHCGHMAVLHLAH